MNEGRKEGRTEGRKEREKRQKLNFIFDRLDSGARDANGWTALHHAAYKGYLHAVELLLQAGANFNTAYRYVSMREVV